MGPEVVRVFGRGGQHDWAPPPLPRCAAKLPERYVSGRTIAAKRRMRQQQSEVDLLDRQGLGGDVDGFKAVLIHKHGSTVRAWRTVFAPDDLGIKPVSYTMFCKGLQEIGYRGRAVTLWRTLCGDMLNRPNPALRLEHLEPELAEQLDALSKVISNKTEGLGIAGVWAEMDRHHSTRATYPELSEFLSSRKMLPRKPKVHLRWVFDALDVHGLGTLTLKDLKFLDHWAHTRQGIALPQEDEARERFEEPAWSPPPAQRKADPGIKELRKFLELRFGSPARAWRLYFDLKGCGALSYVDFGRGCRAVGWNHPHGTVFHQLEEGNGLVTFRNFDPDMAATIDSLHEVVAKELDNNFQQVWDDILDRDGTGVASKSTFVKEMQDHLGLTAQQAKGLFGVLDIGDSGFIAESELDFIEMFETRLSVMRAQGGSMAMSRDLTRGSLASSAPTLPASPSMAGESIQSPSKSTRSMQARRLGHSHTLKKAYLTHMRLDQKLAAKSIDEPVPPWMGQNYFRGAIHTHLTLDKDDESEEEASQFESSATEDDGEVE